MDPFKVYWACIILSLTVSVSVLLYKAISPAVRAAMANAAKPVPAHAKPAAAPAAPVATPVAKVTAAPAKPAAEKPAAPKRGPGRPRKATPAERPEIIPDPRQITVFDYLADLESHPDPKPAAPATPDAREIRLQASALSPYGGWTVFGTSAVTYDPHTFQPDGRFVLDHFDMRYYTAAKLFPADTIIDLYGPEGLRFTVPMADVYDAANS